MSSSLQDLRAQIDAADSELLQALAKRMQLIKQIAPLKHGKPVTDASRESEVRERWVNRAAELGLAPEFATALLAVVFAESKRLQQS